MANQTTASLHKLPVQHIHRILDNMHGKTLFMSCQGVSQRLNNILDNYKPYQVISHCISSPTLRYTILFFKKSIILIPFRRWMTYINYQIVEIYNYVVLHFQRELHVVVRPVVFCEKILLLVSFCLRFHLCFY